MKSVLYYTTGLLLILLSACHAGKSTGKHKHEANTGTHTYGSMASMDMLDKTQVPFTWFAGSGQGKIDWDGQRYSVRFNVRILRDSVIWMQISKFGFEIGRMLVTPDSAFFINRLEHLYGAYRTDDFLEAYKVPADFGMFSKVFTAGAYIPLRLTEVDKGNDGSIIIHGGSGVTAQHWFNADVLSKSYITDKTDHEWTAGYGDYQKTDTGQYFPYHRSNKVIINGQASVFDLEYNSVVIDVPQHFPFSIPSHYERQ